MCVVCSLKLIGNTKGIQVDPLHGCGHNWAEDEGGGWRLHSEVTTQVTSQASWLAGWHSMHLLAGTIHIYWLAQPLALTLTNLLTLTSMSASERGWCMLENLMEKLRASRLWQKGETWWCFVKEFYNFLQVSRHQSPGAVQPQAEEIRPDQVTATPALIGPGQLSSNQSWILLQPIKAIYYYFFLQKSFFKNNNGGKYERS